MLIFLVGCFFVGDDGGGGGVDSEAEADPDCTVAVPDDAKVVESYSQTYSSTPVLVCDGAKVNTITSVDGYALPGSEVSISASSDRIWAARGSTVDEGNDNTELVYEVGASIAGEGTYASTKLCPVLIFTGDIVDDCP